MGSNARERILEGALELLRAEDGASITLDGAAKQAGVTKPGLMYHFATKEALMQAVVDHAAQKWERLMLARLGRPLAEASPREKVAAYVRVALTEPHDRADYAICSDALYTPALSEAWTGRMGPWVCLPDDLPAPERARLTAARLMADGYWTSAATGVFPVAEADRSRILAIADALLNEGDR
ncbi:TetR/AcrR family transcriptional regulator [Actinomadura syzygii]|uniref:TetR/AcrR family transcriptional regulator n=1 Tax=Actinomadura syzygii TaxID=1427538 RepID=A0A5D0UDV0_9ACTN|nr:TetR/AcrR family transcriptional regulator [Actinomadura syzygii]TYC15956.1 TetR/AcrR family transcriptional regulator [Actinomadura syzygii]